MEQKNGHSNNEKVLFHGTTQDTVRVINELGFNRSYSGKNGEKFRSPRRLLLYLDFARISREVTPVLSDAFSAAHYGDGSYFAVNANYSARDIYSRPNEHNEKHMYLCRVLTGDYTLGKKGMIAPPPKASNPAELYDSVVNNQADPKIFVVFHDDSAYPEYLITFK